MAAYPGNFAAPAEGDDHGSQFSGQPADASGFAAPYSGFNGVPISYAGPVGYPYAQPTYVPQATYLPQTTFIQQQVQVPIAVRRPGYNERYVAWKNRQKAFNQYKKATKAAIKGTRTLPATQYAYASQTTYIPQTTVVPQPYGYAPYATAALPQYPQYAQYAPAAASFGGEFQSYSETSQAQPVEPAPAQDEPEIRGTQV